MKICPNCQAKLEDGLQFCEECGYTLPAEAPVDTPTEAPVDTPAEAPAETPTEAPAKKADKKKARKKADKKQAPAGDAPVKKKKNTLVWVLSLVLFLVVASATGIVLILLMNDTPAEGPHQVTFAMNDGSGGAYEMLVVDHQASVTAPGNPQRLGYTFTGWYKDAACAKSFDFSAPIVRNTTVYAGWEEPVTEGALFSGAAGGGTVFAISGIEMRDSTVRVTVNVNSACTLRVQFLDETTEEVLATVSTKTPAYCELTPISIPVTDELPAHYIILADLVDAKGKELCNTYRCIKYTTAFENHLQQTVNDFPGKTVVNFDDSPNKNYGVLSDDIKVIPTGADTNKVSSTFQPIYPEDYDGTQELEYEEYIIIENPDQQVKDLAVGDKVYFKDTNHLLKIATIQTEADGTIVLTASGDVLLTDFYQVLNADMAFGMDQAVQDASQPALAWELVDLQGKGTLSGGIPVEYTPYDWLKISGKLTVSGTLKAELHVDIKWLKVEYEASVVMEYEFKVNIEAKATVDNEDDVKEAMKPVEFTVGRWVLPTSIPGLTATVKPTLPIEWSLEGGLAFEYVNKSTSGFVWNNDGKQNISKKESTTKLQAEAKFELKVGPKMELSVEFCKEVLKAKLTLAAGAKVEAQIAHGGEWTDAESKHACSLCLDGSAKWFVEVSAKLSYKFGKNTKGKPLLSGDLVKWTIVDLEGNFVLSPKFFISIFNEEESIYNGKLKFGWGECENKQYRTTFVVKDPTGSEVTGISVSVAYKSGDNVGSGMTPFALYLYKGSYVAQANDDNAQASKNFEVNKKAQTVTLQVTANGQLSGKVCKASDRITAISDATIKVYANGLLAATVFSDSDGNYTMTLPVGTYWVTITAEGYLDFASYATVQPNVNTYMETFLMIEGEEGTIGTASGTVINSLFGTSESGVSLQFVKDWNNTNPNAEVLTTVITDGSGMYSVELPIGNYTVRASKEEFNDASFNIVVQEGTTDNQNGTITPILGEGVGNQYLITLTWEENPRDLDSHLEGRTAAGDWFHVYFSDKSAYDGDMLACNLDYDDTTSYGPEHITLVVTGDEAYYYYIHHFAGNGTISTSGAQITVEQGNTLVAVYNVPTDMGSDLYWNVFAIKNGQLITANTITSSPDTSYAE